MDLTFHGVRAHVPSPGAETARYGGNTSCAALRTDGGALLVLDAGTGIVGLGRALLASGPFARGEGRAALLLGRARADRLQGLPFFAPLHVDGNRFEVHASTDCASSLPRLFDRSVSPLFGLEHLGARVGVSPVAPGTRFAVADAHVHAVAVAGGLAWRIESAGRALAWAPDAIDAGDDALAALGGVDLLVADGSRAARAVRLAAGTGARHLALSLHNTDASDDDLDALGADARVLLDAHGARATALTVVREGLALAL